MWVEEVEVVEGCGWKDEWVWLKRLGVVSGVVVMTSGHQGILSTHELDPLC